MPQGASKLELDLGGILGAFFFTLSFSLVPPEPSFGYVFRVRVVRKAPTRLPTVGCPYPVFVPVPGLTGATRFFPSQPG